MTGPGPSRGPLRMSSRPPRPPLRTALLVGGLVLLGTVLSCGAMIAFIEIVGSNPEVQARVRGTATAETALLLTAQAETNRNVARLDAAEVVLTETFDGPAAALSLDPAGLREGTYQAMYTLTGFQFMPWAEPLTDFAAEVSCRITGGNGACGLFFGGQPRAAGGYDYHAFYLTAEGYGYETAAPAGQTTSATGTTNAHLAGDWNHLIVVRLENQVWYTLNNKEVEHLTLAEPALVTGAIGLIGGRLDEGAQAEVAFDNLVLRRIP